MMKKDIKNSFNLNNRYQVSGIIITLIDSLISLLLLVEVLTGTKTKRSAVLLNLFQGQEQGQQFTQSMMGSSFAKQQKRQLHD